MLIALLVLIGVNLIVIVVLLSAVLSRKRWITRQAGAFRGAVRIVDGEAPGLGVKWTRGYGRWVRDILVWTKAPFLFRNDLVLVDSLIAGPRPAKPGEVKRLGKHPAVAGSSGRGRRADRTRLGGRARSGTRAVPRDVGHRRWPADEQPRVNQLTDSLPSRSRPARLCVIDRCKKHAARCSGPRLTPCALARLSK